MLVASVVRTELTKYLGLNIRTLKSGQMISGAKVLAPTGYRLPTNAELLHRVKQEFERALVQKHNISVMN